jgi:hypothetical protein
MARVPPFHDGRARVVSFRARRHRAGAGGVAALVEQFQFVRSEVTELESHGHADAGDGPGDRLVKSHESWMARPARLLGTPHDLAHAAVLHRVVGELLADSVVGYVDTHTLAYAGTALQRLAVSTPAIAGV